MLRMAVLVSGGGTNLQAIIDSIGNGTVTNAEIAVVISNNRSAYALERAKQNGIDAAVVSPKDYETREAFNQALLEKIQSYQVDLVVLPCGHPEDHGGCLSKPDHQYSSVPDPFLLRNRLLWAQGS